MEIKELKIEGFKSLGSIQLNDLNPFTVFVGPNGAGKSNIFEALEFWALCNIMNATEASKTFGNFSEILNQLLPDPTIKFLLDLGDVKPSLDLYPTNKEGNTSISTGSSHFSDLLAKSFEKSHPGVSQLPNITKHPSYIHFFNFTRLFVDKSKTVKRVIQDDSKLASDASNLEKVLKRILKNKIYKAEIEEILQLLIPGFDRIDVVTEELSGSDNLVVYEQSLKKPLTKRLISDGTYNIISLITAIYQSEEPQFLCIEEPENGLNPKVVKELVTIFRQKCQEKGHFIWFNTHSQTLVSELSTDEIVLVDKVDGLTQVKQIKGMNLHGMKMDEALMTNALGGGIPW